MFFGFRPTSGFTFALSQPRTNKAFCKIEYLVEDKLNEALEYWEQARLQGSDTISESLIAKKIVDEIILTMKKGRRHGMCDEVMEGLVDILYSDKTRAEFFRLNVGSDSFLH